MSIVESPIKLIDTTLLTKYINRCCSCSINNIKDNVFISMNNITCVEIKEYNLLDSNFQNLVDYIIPLYIDLGILSPKKDFKKYFILGKRFTWNKIKGLGVENLSEHIDSIRWKDIYNVFNNQGELDLNTLLLYIKYLVWYFRKAIVDSLIINIINSQSTNLNAFSAGSTKIDSDYDITLNGNYLYISNSIFIFNQIISNIFHDTPDILFDTNIYGLSFINSSPSSFKSVKYNCGNDFYLDIIESETDKNDFDIMQNIWSLTKVILKIDSLEHYDEVMYTILYNTILNLGTYKNLLSLINMFIEDSPPIPYNYSFIIKDINKFNKTPLEYMNYISYINYNGSETYFSRGAFLDVVVNGQICKKNIVKLNLNDYYDSFVENSIDLLTHYHKEKYTMRLLSSFSEILTIFQTKYSDIYSLNKSVLNNINSNLDNLKKLQNTCTRGELTCSRLLISDLCIQNIFNLTNVYFRIYSRDQINSGIKRFHSEYKKFPNLNNKLQIDTESDNILRNISPRKNSLPF